MLAASEYSLWSVMQQRASAVAEFERQLALIAGARADVTKALEGSRSAKLRRFLEEEGVERILLELGHYSTSVAYGRYKGLRFYEQVESAVKEQQVLWDKNVLIMLDPPGEIGKVGIRFATWPLALELPAG